MKNSYLDLFGKSSSIQFKRTGNNTAYKFFWGIPVKRNKVLQSEGNNKPPIFFLEIIFKNCLSTVSSLSMVCLYLVFLITQLTPPLTRSLSVYPHTASRGLLIRFLLWPRPRTKHREEWETGRASAPPHSPSSPLHINSLSPS